MGKIVYNSHIYAINLKPSSTFYMKENIHCTLTDLWSLINADEILVPRISTRYKAKFLNILSKFGTCLKSHHALFWPLEVYFKGLSKVCVIRIGAKRLSLQKQTKKQTIYLTV